MKIEPRLRLPEDTFSAQENGADNRLQSHFNDLRRLLKSGHNSTPVCAPDCPAASPTRCSRHCPDVAHTMSSDPENPLEKGIAPLVYELKRLEAFQPCWSCEGHCDSSGKLWKKPRVWFYCDSVVHLRVLASGLKELHLAGRLSTPWRVELTFSDPDNPDTTFAIEPNLDDVDDNDRSALKALQQDAAAIADHLHHTALDEARKLMTGLS